MNFLYEDLNSNLKSNHNHQGQSSSFIVYYYTMSSNI